MVVALVKRYPRRRVLEEIEPPRQDRRFTEPGWCGDERQLRLRSAIQALAQRVASDPEVKTAAMQVATGVVTTAQQVVAEQSVHIQDALKTAAERISAAQSQHEKVKKP